MATHPSSVLLAAQEKLLQLRQLVQREPGELRSDVATRRGAEGPTVWPAHLGWHSEAVSRYLNKSAVRSEQLSVSSQQSSVPSLQSLNLSVAQSPHLTLSPDFALALLNHNRVAESRIWFLLRHLDEDGRGWMTMAGVRQHLSEKTSCWWVCGWRQLRILLAQGDGLFWRRDGERLWLCSQVKVAAALGLTRLSGHPISLPLSILTRPIGEVKAHFYASFHSGRNTDHQPIARATLSQLSGLSPQTQRSYEKRVGVRPQANFALGELATPENQEEAAWQQGHAFFPFNDKNGQHGRTNSTYLAWQLPNDYTGPHQRQSKRRHKRLNRKLADLRQQGTVGNGPFRKQYFGNGCDAIKEQKGQDVYWRGRKQNRGGQIWYLLGQSEQKKEIKRLRD